jgi:hypothetical protein
MRGKTKVLLFGEKRQHSLEDEERLPTRRDTKLTPTG